MEFRWTEIVRLCGGGQTIVDQIPQPRTFQLPVVVQHLADDWPAFREDRWSFSQLKHRFSRRYFSINGQDTPMQMGDFLDRYVGTLNDNSTTETEVVKLSTHLQTFLTTSVPLTETHLHNLIQTINHHLTPSSSLSLDVTSPRSIFDPSFEFDAPELLDDYHIPPLFTTTTSTTTTTHNKHHHDDLLSIIPEPYRPDHRWFLVGPKGSGSRLHVDPLSTSAWNTLVVGCKHWIIIEPSSSSSSSVVRRIYSFFQHPGETVVVPREWSHAVLNLSFTTAITHNYVAPHEDDVRAFFQACRVERERLQGVGLGIGVGLDVKEEEGLGAWEEGDMRRWETLMRENI